MSFSTIIVTGRYESGAGPARGTVTFTRSATLRDSTTGEVALPTPLVAHLDSEGVVRVPLIATDDKTTIPTGSTYTVHEAAGDCTRTYTITVPYATPNGVLDLVTVAPGAYPGSVQLVAVTGGSGGGAALGTANTWTAPQTFPSHTRLASATADTSLELHAPTGHVNIVSFQIDGTEYWEFFADGHTFGVYHAPTNVTRLSVDDGGNMTLNYQLNLGAALTLPTGGGARVLAFEGPALTAQQWPGAGTVAPDSLILQTSPFTTGNVGTGTGSSLLFQADTTAEFLQDQARVTATWGGDVTTATRKARLTATVQDAAGRREGWRIEADGSAPRLGVLGAAAVARQSLPAAATDAAGTQALVNAIRALLIAFGFAG